MMNENIINRVREPLTCVFSVVLIALFCSWLHNLYSSKLILGDEIWAATAVLGSPLDNVVFTLRFDLHPPLYYLLLDFWALISYSDRWLLFSSAILHSATVYMVYGFVRKQTETYMGIIAAILVFVSPMLFLYSDSLRMYALIELLSTRLFILTYQISHQGKDNRAYSIEYFILALALAYTHAIGILFVFFHFLFGFVSCIQNKIGIRQLKYWVLLNSVIAILSIPSVVNGALKSVSHSYVPTWEQFFNTISTLYLGNVFGWWGIVIVVPLVIFLVRSSMASLRVLLVYLVLPPLVFWLVSILLKPVWLDRNLLFAVPVSLIGLVFVYRDTRGIFQKFSIILILVFICLGFIKNWQKINEQTSAEETSVARVVSKLIRTETKGTRCIIIEDKLRDFWVLLRYYGGTSWGNPLVSQPPTNRRWESYLGKLPKKLVSYLKLKDQADFHQTQGSILASGWSKRCFGDDINEIFVVTRDPSDHLSNLIDQAELRTKKHLVFKLEREALISIGK